MASPVLPSSFCDAIPSANSDLCTRMTRWLNVPQLLCDLFSWMLNSDGSVTDEFKAEIAQFSSPTGMVAYFATLNVGAGWLLCDGSDVSRSTYANLFAQIGTRYGVGDGSSTFTLPDARGRSPIGAGQGAGLTNRDVNTINVGEESHTQTIAELAAHSHTWNGPVDRTAIRATSNNQFCWQGSVDEETEVTGSSTPMNVIHPSLILYCFIKT